MQDAAEGWRDTETTPRGSDRNLEILLKDYQPTSVGRSSDLFLERSHSNTTIYINQSNLLKMGLVLCEGSVQEKAAVLVEVAAVVEGG